MTNEQIINEAIRLTSEREYRSALILWKELNDLPFLDPESKCLYLLNERRCRTALGQHEIAQQLLDSVEKTDTAKQFSLEVELARIDELYNQRKFVEATERSQRFLKEKADLLASPEFELIAYEQKLRLACGLVSANEFAAGLHLLTELFPAAQDQDKSQIRYYRVVAYLRLKQEDAAIEDLKQILLVGGHDQWTANAHYNLGRIYEDREAFAWAKQHLENAELLKDVITVPMWEIYISLSNVCFKLNEVEAGWKYRKLTEANRV